MSKQNLKKKKKSLNHPKRVCMNLSKLWQIVKVREAWHAAVHGAAVSDTT